MARLDAAAFDLPVERLREGWYTDAYFNHARETLEGEGLHPRVLMQVFQRHDAVLGGIDEALAVLRLCAGSRRADATWEAGWERLEVKALEEGDRIEPQETVLTIEGDYGLFAHLETAYLGALARRTLVMRNAAEVVAAAAGKPVLYFAARHDHWLMQPGDGYAAHVAGAAGVTTGAQGSLWGGRGVGTVPHALIAAFGGDTVAAARAFARRFAGSLDISVLVDFENDSVATSVAVAEALGDDLWGVRLDTSHSVVDRALADEPGPHATRAGVTPELVRRVRAALDEAGHDRVRIVVSGGFDTERILAFEREGAPVDAYGVGSALRRGENDFTADVVRVDGRPCAKTGREERPNERLRPVA
jgi:nicotinate phosphoribosyltransferase